MKRTILVLLVLSLIALAGCSRESKPLVIPDKILKPNPVMVIAASIGKHELSAVELNYFYIDFINLYCSRYSSFLNYFIDSGSPISEQMYDESTQVTWADFFLESALDSAKNNYALYDAAKVAGYQLSEEEKSAAEMMVNDLQSTADNYGYDTTDEYLVAMYGQGSTIDSYLKYYEVTALASSYFNSYSDTLRDCYTNADLRSFEAGREREYNTYTYASYYMNIDHYNDGDISSAEAKMKAVAESLASPENNTVQALNNAITNLETSDDPNRPNSCSENKDIQYSKLNSVLQAWISDPVRQEGDIVALPYYDEAGSGVQNLKGYYVILFQGRNDNRFPLKNVRHILVNYKGGTSDDYGTTVYSDEEKATAKAEAEALLKQWQEGEQTEASFAALATANSLDPGSKDNGGLYTDIFPGQMVAPFEDWCYDSNRKPGDTGLVQADYGFHVMYFSGDSETNFRDYMITGELIERDITQWQTELSNATTVIQRDTSYINRDLVLDGGTTHTNH